jgi:hypothetical protein
MTSLCLESTPAGGWHLRLHDSLLELPTAHIDGCTLRAVTQTPLPNGGLHVQRVLARPTAAARITIEESWRPTAHGLHWDVTVSDDGPAWTAPVLLSCPYPVTASTRLWAPWADPRPEPAMAMETDRGVADGLLPDNPAINDWCDPLVPHPWQPLHFWYGAPRYTYAQPRIAYCPFRRDVVCIPMLTLLEEDTDTGLTIAVSHDTRVLDLTLATQESGAIALTHHYHRLGEGRPVQFGVDFAVHAADWRAALGWATDYYADYLVPPLPEAHLISGTGAYSMREMDFDAGLMRRLAFGVNWKASFDFPYMGMFLPPVAPETPWTAFTGATATLSQLRAYSQRMREEGFHVLNYFNVTEFGTRMTYPAPEPLPTADPSWTDPQTFLYTEFPAALLRIPADEVAQDHPFYGRTHPGTPYETWEGALVMDCGEPTYQAFLLEQAQRHLDELPESAGLCIDRLDWLRMYNHDRADGVSRIGAHDVAALTVSWDALLARLGPLLHGAGKVLFVNNHHKRLDLLRHVDGLFDEFTYGGCPLNTTALLAVRKPALGWTSSEGDLQPDPDAFFQRYLYLGVFPMAPFPGNDHALRPSEWVTAQYLRYSPLLTAMRGRQWVLIPRAIEVVDGQAKANLFTVPGGWVAPVVFAGEVETVTCVVRGLPVTASLHCEALLPGQETAVPVVWQPGEDGDSVSVVIPVHAGCAMVRITVEVSQRNSPG